MSTHPIKIRFGFKAGRRNAVKVTTSLRIPEHDHPKQIHLGYLAGGSELLDTNLDRLDSTLREKLEIWHPSRAADLIDRADAKRKWAKRGEKRPKVDRESSLEQFARWLRSDFSSTLPCFGGVPCEPPKASDFELDLFSLSGDDPFEVFFNDSWEVLERRLNRPDLDPVDLESWWKTQELPRLLQRYFAFCQHRQEKFSPTGFIHYVTGNVVRGYAVREYLRFSKL